MSTEQTKKDLRDISHLFLSSVRDRQTNGAPRPQRIAPAARTDQTVDLTPEELAEVIGDADADQQMAGPAARASIVLNSHLEHRAGERARQYAAHLTAANSTVGLIELEAQSLRVTLFHRTPDKAMGEPAAVMPLDERCISQVLQELAYDVDRWLITMPAGRTNEIRHAMRQVGHYVLLSDCNADGVISAYRMLKSVAELARDGDLPRLSLAVLGSTDEVQAGAAYRRICGVARQFLRWRVEMEAPVAANTSNAVGELILHCRGDAERGVGPQWKAVAEMVAVLAERASVAGEAAASSSVAAETPAMTSPAPQPKIAPPAEAAAPAIAMQPFADDENTMDEVLELTGGDGAASVLSAVIDGTPQQWLACPILPPMCPEARLAVSRDRSITLLAVSKKGLPELRLIGEAFQWLCQNRNLIAMALPQLAIDAHQLPRLKLFVDSADATADQLQPILNAGHVSVTAYRRVRFAGRAGLLLEAA